MAPLCLRPVLLLALILPPLAAAPSALAAESPVQDGVAVSSTCPPELPPRLCEVLGPLLAFVGVPYAQVAYMGTCCRIDCVYDALLNESVAVEADLYEVEVGVDGKSGRTVLLLAHVPVVVVRTYAGNVC